MRQTLLILCAAFGGALASPILAEEPIPGKPLVTQQHAVAIVKEFCAAAGITLRGEPVARFKTDHIGRPPMWEVDGFQVDAYAGGVVAAMTSKGRSPAETQGPPMVESDAAAAIASRFAALLGIPGDARLISVELINPFGDRPQFAGVWWVRWKRYLGDVQYEDDWAVAKVDAYTGAALGGSRFWYTVPPDPTEFRLTPDQAVQVANDMLARKGKPPDSVSPVEIKIVRPNGYWSGKMVETSLFKPSRITYVMTLWSPETYQYRDDGGQPKTGTWYWPNIVWVDVENGNILGGTSARGAGPLPEEAKPYQPGNPVPTAFKELPKLPPPPHFTSFSLPPILTVIVAAAVLGGGGLALRRLRRRRRPPPSRESRPSPTP